METNFRKEKTMRTKILLIFITAICAVLFVGMINRSYEYYEPEIAMKYPTLQFVFLKPELPDNYKIEALPIDTKVQLLAFNRVIEINEAMGVFGQIIAFVLLQLFLTFLVIKWIKNYRIKYFFVDLFFYMLSLFVLALATATSVFSSQFVLFAILILGFNLIVNFFLRNMVFKKMTSTIKPN